MTISKYEDIFLQFGFSAPAILVLIIPGLPRWEVFSLCMVHHQGSIIIVS